MVIPGLRELLRSPIIALYSRATAAELPSYCTTLGLASPPDEGSKRERMTASFEATADDELVRVAHLFLQHFPPVAQLRNNIQDLIWSTHAAPEIPKRYRRELANNLTPIELYLNATHFERLLDRLWILDDDLISGFFTGKPAGLRAEIYQHVFRNPEDWSIDYLFERLGAYESSDHRFVLFIEGLASADVRPEATEQLKFVRIVNDSLSPCQVEFREVGLDGGYPVFKITSLKARVTGPPKNLIFASRVKPDIRFKDAINNNIEIASNAEKVLIYDRPISADGLRWSDLQDWWIEIKNLGRDEAKASLYKRLLSSLPPESPPQHLLFKTYFRRFRQAIPELPALLPEIWLHWDPKTVEERGPHALLRFRMDFLMLFPNSVRVVIEVDGKHHYANEQGRANPAAYGSMMEADRDLRFSGYEVYRFGAAELLQPVEGTAKVIEFFERLFKSHRISIP